MMLYAFKEDVVESKPSLEALILLLIYRTAWKEKFGNEVIHRSWRSYDWDALDELRDQGLISGGMKAKSVYLTDEGLEKAKELSEKIHLVD